MIDAVFKNKYTNETFVVIDLEIVKVGFDDFDIVYTLRGLDGTFRINHDLFTHYEQVFDPVIYRDMLGWRISDQGHATLNGLVYNTRDEARDALLRHNL